MEELKGGDSVLWRRGGDLFTSTIHDETLLFHEREQEYFSLCGVAQEIWKLLEQPRTLNSIVEVLVGQFEVEREICRKEVAAFLLELQKLHLVEEG